MAAAGPSRSPSATGGPPPPVPPVAPPPPVAATPPGWYHDPWGMAEWRWWDGWAWTANVSTGKERKPRLRGWLSWPVVIGALFAVPTAAFLAVQDPLVLLLAFVPVLIVGPVLWWLDRVEPEPIEARGHAFLWGFTIAGLVAGILNSIVFAVSNETVAAVASAPLTEETMKMLGIIWALRRGEVDGVTDGLVYAGWVALGFAVVENFLYFSDASTQGMLIGVFVTRALLTPFAHPLFTAWSGLAIGFAVARAKPVPLHLLWGLPAAMLLHAAWNGSLTYAADDADILLVALPAFIGIFVVSAIAIVVVRRREQANFVALVPTLAERYGLSAQEVAVFGDWRTMLATRQQIPRDSRARFDTVHGNLARLASLHARPGPLDIAHEAVLNARLQKARSGR